MAKRKSPTTTHTEATPPSPPLPSAQPSIASAWDDWRAGYLDSRGYDAGTLLHLQGAFYGGAWGALAVLGNTDVADRLDALIEELQAFTQQVRGVQ